MTTTPDIEAIRKRAEEIGARDIGDDVLLSKPVLVGDLNELTKYIVPALLSHIAALSAQDDARDSALEEVCAAQPSTAAEPKTDYEVGFLHGVLAYGREVRALKFKPATSTAERRTGVQDRRKSAEGNEQVAARRNYGTTEFGRRANDRARWTQPPAPDVKQGLADAHHYLKNWVRDTMPHAASSVSRGTLEHFAEEIQWWIDYRLAELDTRLGEKS
jgi:hypothetical protein